MSGAHEAALREAWARPAGAHLGQVFHAPFVTVLLAERSGGERMAVALEVARDALARCGVSPGRQLVLLASSEAAPPGAREEARALRRRLGLPVVVHDPERSPSMHVHPGDPLALELDDELREAEAVMLVSALRPRARFGERGGMELLVPGSVSRATGERCNALARTPEGRAAIRQAAATACRIDYALLWSESGEPRAWAGEPDAALAAAGAALSRDDALPGESP